MNIKSVLTAIVIIAGIYHFGVWHKEETIPTESNARDLVKYSQFIKHLRKENIEFVDIQNEKIIFETKDNKKLKTIDPGDPYLISELLDHNIEVAGHLPEKPTRSIIDTLIGWAPMFLFIGIWIWFMKSGSMGGGSAGAAAKFGKSKATLHGEENIKTRFTDVAGIEEAKEEVSQMVNFLKNPSKYQKIGGKIPSGALMVGSPGCGKTLLARAIAGEAKVPFFTISGSDFVEMFVGVGASRVRDLFEEAKKNAPCIIFIDEIDAIGRHRGTGMGGGNDEREQTLNQLLVEMDGFVEGEAPVIVLAATNRADVLDPALLRPGRFDREINVSNPDVKGRKQILDVHLGNILTAPSLRIMDIAQGTTGFSGAELANLVNEAALQAAETDKSEVSMVELEWAKDKAIMGAETAKVMPESEKKMTAYHEAGHAIVGRLSPEHDPVYKVSIMPRGRALGVTMFLPDEDQYSASRQKLNSCIATLFGGRIAEEIFFGDDAVSTGASNDIERATSIAKNMVTKWGLSKKVGPIQFDTTPDGGGPNVGMQQGMSQDGGVPLASSDIKLIGEEIRKIIDKNYETATNLILKHKEKIHIMAKALMKYETIDKFQIDEIMEGKIPGAPEGWEEIIAT